LLSIIFPPYSEITITNLSEFNSQGQQTQGDSRSTVLDFVLTFYYFIMYIQNSKSLVTFTEIITVHCCLFYQTHFKSIVQCKKEQQQEDEEEGILADEHEILINHINLLR
jgi:hypothetical protein